MGCPKSSEQILRNSGAKLFSLVSNEVHGGAESADPVVEEGGRHSGCFFVGQSHQLDILGEGVCGAVKELLSVL